MGERVSESYLGWWRIYRERERSINPWTLTLLALSLMLSRWISFVFLLAVFYFLEKSSNNPLSPFRLIMCWDSRRQKLCVLQNSILPKTQDRVDQKKEMAICEWFDDEERDLERQRKELFIQTEKIRKKDMRVIWWCRGKKTNELNWIQTREIYIYIYI